MVQSIVGTTKPQIPYGACDRNGLTPRINPPIYSCDGDGLVAKAPEITVEDTAKGVGKAVKAVKDFFVKKPAKNDASQVSTPSIQEETNSEKSSTKARFISTAILLVGGALLGYGHRKHIEKGVNAVKGKIAEWASTGTGEKIVSKGKDLLAKAKDAIFVKA
ncbi:hypothetical protein IJ818_02035 [bacterium]|nr:hypothetical protein [bacterium]